MYGGHLTGAVIEYVTENGQQKEQETRTQTETETKTGTATETETKTEAGTKIDTTTTTEKEKETEGGNSTFKLCCRHDESCKVTLLQIKAKEQYIIPEGPDIIQYPELK